MAGRLLESLQAVRLPDGFGQENVVSGAFRASAIKSLCPRREWVVAKEGLRLAPEERKGDFAWIVESGTALHGMLQGRLGQLALGDVFQGWWSCPRCHHSYVGPDRDGALPHGWREAPGSCDVCGHMGVFRYEELSFHWKDLDLTGHADGVYVWPDGRVELVEYKTVNPGVFRVRDPFQEGRPDPDHVVQASLYAHGAGLEWVRLVYVNRGSYGLKDALAEWEIRVDEDLVHAALGKVRMAREGRQGVEQPRLALCKSPRSAQAKRCPVASWCFR